ncbi:hypothetical protein [Marinobacterium litorale]|uniref:hypothetical protein n=1 Tax=Marinobacterium litorale TaxID=404770 RepID=UPI000412B707|nr:hypothetical protein [Marinobacterium litorale]
MNTQVLTGDVGDEQEHVGKPVCIDCGDLLRDGDRLQCNLCADEDLVLMASPTNSPEIPDSSDHIADAGEVVGMAARYPAYYKDVRHLDSVDVYQVHNLFGIDDPTGCIHHASKKLLLSGARTGGKPKRKDIQEARDTLTRWLEITEVRNV